KHIIQATDNFDLDQLLPIGVKIEQEGEAIFRIEELLNIPEDKNIILNDKTLDIYHNLKQSNYTVILSPGTYSDRFEIGFYNNNSLGNNEVEYSNIKLSYANDIESILISNPKKENLKSVKLINILGQVIFSKEINSSENYHELKVKNISSGTYILKLEGENGTTSNKVSVK
ncbi:T9SS type A sorting domain-containing protein, partial [Flavobacteriaceae sp. LMIT009]